MTFLTGLALAVAALAAAPIVAHLLRRGRAQERPFAALELLPVVEAQARQRSRLSDRSLLSLRLLVIGALALLGATPFVRCSDLAIERPQGASVALAILLDDSHSMRALTASGKTRFEAARQGALQLLSSLREGDAVSLVLAGAPARVALSATGDLGSARRLLQQLEPSDRGGDLPSALQLARSTLGDLDQPDRRLVALSDLAGMGAAGAAFGRSEQGTQQSAELLTPLEALREPVADCGIVSAQRQGPRLSVEIACNASATEAREVVLRPSGNTASPGAQTRLELKPKPGIQTLNYRLLDREAPSQVELRPSDDNPSNDRGEVSRGVQGTRVALVSDADRASAATGGPPLLEQALRALRPEIRLQPRHRVPDEPADLQSASLLIVDDPAGLTPAARTTLASWVDAGGVALALLGPASAQLSLSSSLEPFAQRSARWEPVEAPASVDAESTRWLPDAERSLQNLTRHGRTRLDGALLPGAVVRARWEDGVPFIAERRLGRGVLWTVGLPVGVQHSELALRAEFVALLEHVLRETAQRQGPRTSVAGAPWWFGPADRVQVEGPEGGIAVEPAPCGSGGAACEAGRQLVVPPLAGAYTVTLNGAEQTRWAYPPAEEIVAPPAAEEALATSAAPARTAEAGRVDASKQLALALLALLALETGLRAVRLWRQRPRLQGR